jgi:hypothetical protein
MFNVHFDRMNWFKRDLPLSLVALVTVLSICTESGLLWRTRLQAATAISQLEHEKRERENLQRQLPALTEENEQSIARELATAKQKLVEAQNALSAPGDSDVGSLPRQPIEAYFEIANFVEKMRGMAAESRVTIRPDERFGFSSHVSEAPSQEFLSDVLRQCVAVQFLVGTLFDSHPATFISVQREHPLTVSQRGDRNKGRSGERGGAGSTERNEPVDFFEIAQAISLRMPDKIETDAFKVEFSGQTGALRDFLNQLARSSQPFSVRCVEVEPFNAPGIKTSAAATPLSVPIIGQVISRFRVTVELIRPLDQTEMPAS